MKRGIIDFLFRVFCLLFGTGAITVGCLSLFLVLDNLRSMLWFEAPFTPCLDLLCVLVGVGAIHVGVSALSRVFNSIE
jgi:hypothetical protein